MFNKSYNQVSEECAVLNRKLRGHKGGKLNSPSLVAKLQAQGSAADQEEFFFFTNVMICAAIVTIYFLIRGLFTK